MDGYSIILVMRKYERLYLRIKEEIATGMLGEGDRLLSIREESRASSVSINTVIAAYDLLAEEGLIRSRDRGGYRVCSAATTLALEDDSPRPGKSCHAAAREAGERIDQLYERLINIDPSFASAAPDQDILPGEQLRHLASKLPTTWMEHNETRGDYSLRQRLVQANRETDGPTAPEDLVVTNGATEALTLILHNVLRPGDTVALESPVYFNYFRQLSPLGVKIVEIPMTREGMDWEMLERECRKEPVRLVITQPNVQNPTGITMTEGHRKELLSLAEKRGFYVVQDDVYGDLSYGPIRPGNLSAISDYPRVLQVSSFSKSLSPGLRIGWLRAPGMAAEFAEAKLRLSMESSRLPQAILSRYIGTRDHRRHLIQIRKSLARRIDDHLSCLSGVLPPGSRVRRPDGGCLLWIRYPDDINGTELFERAARGGLIVSPGTMFSSGNRFDNYLRLNTGHELTGERMDKLKLLMTP